LFLLSPDTGQQGGFSQERPDVHALSGKAVRTLDAEVIHEIRTQSPCGRLGHLAIGFFSNIFT
jgi:hypothetical protein